MKFLHYEVSARVGDLVHVVLRGTEANVLVMDDQNFHSYRSGDNTGISEAITSNRLSTSPFLQPGNGTSWSTLVVAPGTSKLVSA